MASGDSLLKSSAVAMPVVFRLIIGVVLAIIWPFRFRSADFDFPNSPVGSQWQVEEELKSQKIDDEERRRLEKALWKFMALHSFT